MHSEDVERNEWAEQSDQNVVVQHEEMARNNRMGNEEEYSVAKMMSECDKQGQV